MKSREDLLRTSRAYWQSRAVLTGLEVGVYEALGRRRLGAAALARRTGAEPRALGLLLDALAGMGVLEKRKSSYALAPAMLPLLTDGPASALSMLRHHQGMWETWSRLTECVRGGRPARSEVSFRGDAGAARAFTLAMRDGARRLAPAVAEEIPLRTRKVLLDLGGGPGVYATWFARRNPGLRVVVVDLPDVAAVGEDLVAGEADVAGRVSYHRADLDRDPLPGGADAAFLSHVIHSQTEEEVRSLFGRVAGALAPKGLFVVRDFFLERDGVSPPGNSLFALNMLVHTEGGRTYTFDEVARWLLGAGFARVRRRRSRAAPDADYLFGYLPGGGPPS